MDSILPALRDSVPVLARNRASGVIPHTSRPGLWTSVRGCGYRLRMAFALVELSTDNLPAVLRIPPAPGEKAYVAPVAWSIAEAYITPTAWPRAIVDGVDVVGFVMANWDPDNEFEAFRSGIWRLNIADEAKGRGVGRFAVEEIAAEARRRGFDKITALWEQADDGPAGFYRAVGFRQTGELFGEAVGELRV